MSFIILILGVIIGILYLKIVIENGYGIGIINTKKTKYDYNQKRKDLFQIKNILVSILLGIKKSKK